jgi:hypothetical protein
MFEHFMYSHKSGSCIEQLRGGELNLVWLSAYFSVTGYKAIYIAWNFSLNHFSYTNTVGFVAMKYNKKIHRTKREQKKDVR